MGNSSCGGKASLAEWAAHVLASMGARLEMLRPVTGKAKPTDEKGSLTLTIMILL
jgi:hypothetical protein